MAGDAADLTFIRCPSCRSLVPAMSTRCRMCGFVLTSEASSGQGTTKSLGVGLKESSSDITDDLANGASDLSLVDVYELESQELKSGDSEPATRVEDVKVAEPKSRIRTRTSSEHDPNMADAVKRAREGLSQKLSESAAKVDEATPAKVAGADSKISNSLTSDNPLGEYLAVDDENSRPGGVSAEAAVAEIESSSEKKSSPFRIASGRDRGKTFRVGGEAAVRRGATVVASTPPLVDDAALAEDVKRTEDLNHAEALEDTSPQHSGDADFHDDGTADAGVIQDPFVGLDDEATDDKLHKAETWLALGEDIAQLGEYAQTDEEVEADPAQDAPQGDSQHLLEAHETGLSETIDPAAGESAIEEDLTPEEDLTTVHKDVEVNEQPAGKTKPKPIFRGHEEGDNPGRQSKSGNAQQEDESDQALIGWFVSYDEKRGQSLELREGKRFITSRLIKENDFIVDDGSISTPHAMMAASPQGVKVQDLMSETGLFIRRGGTADWKQEEDAVRLNHGDWVKFGKVAYLVCLIPHNSAALVDKRDGS